MKSIARKDSKRMVQSETNYHFCGARTVEESPKGATSSAAKQEMVVCGALIKNKDAAGKGCAWGWYQSSEREETPGTGRERNEGEAVSDSACSTVVCAVCTTDRSKDSKAEKTLGIAIDKTRKKIPSPIEERILIGMKNCGFLVQCDEHRTATKCLNPFFYPCFSAPAGSIRLKKTGVKRPVSYEARYPSTLL